MSNVIDILDKDNALLSRYPFLIQLKYAEPNSEGNTFPDFYIKEGIVEHFIIDGSKKNKKGSSFKIEEAKKDKYSDLKMKNNINKAYNVPLEIGAFQTISEVDEYTDFSYDNFVDTFKKTFESHIDSLKNSRYGNSKNKIFLIEQQGCKMVVDKNNINCNFYKIRLDRKLLKYLTTFSGLLDYIVYYNVDEIEVIDMMFLHNYIASAPKNITVTGGRFLKEKNAVIINTKYLKY